MHIFSKYKTKKSGSKEPLLNCMDNINGLAEFSKVLDSSYHL